MDNWTCPICGKKIPKVLWLLGAEGAIAMHLRVHQAEVLESLIVEVRKVVATNPMSPLAESLVKLVQVTDAIDQVRKVE